MACIDPSMPAAPMEVAEAVGRLALNDWSWGQTKVQPASDASLIWSWGALQLSNFFLFGQSTKRKLWQDKLQECGEVSYNGAAFVARN